MGQKWFVKFSLETLQRFDPATRLKDVSVKHSRMVGGMEHDIWARRYKEILGRLMLHSF